MNWPKTAAAMLMGMATGWSWSQMRKKMMSGMEAWIQRIHCHENFLLRSRLAPNGMFTSRQTALTSRTFSHMVMV